MARISVQLTVLGQTGRGGGYAVTVAGKDFTIIGRVNSMDIDQIERRGLKVIIIPPHDTADLPQEIEESCDQSRTRPSIRLYNVPTNWWNSRTPIECTAGA